MIKNFIVLLYFSCFSLVASELNQSRVSNFPIWSELTPFEITSLNRLSAAKRGGNDALLRLYLMASGDIRTTTEYLKIKKDVDKFFDIFGAEILSEKKYWKKGYLLNRAMHSYFFNNKQLDSSLNYVENQSQLSEIFRSRHYNCISSTLLYIHLARKIDLPVKAVVLPTHTFVEMELENGQKIDVETTSASGFDWVHDRKFYKNVAKNWFSERELNPSTFEDYQNREIIEPWLLIPLNMRNQHTNPKLMILSDRLRLQEMAASIDGNQQQTLLSLLYVYNELFNQYNKSPEKTDLIELYEISYTAVVDRLNTLVKVDQELNALAHWYFYQATQSYLDAGFVDKAEKIFLRHYLAVRELAAQEPKIFSNYRAAFNDLLKHYLKQKQYQQADAFISKVHKIGLDDEKWQQSVLWYYSTRSKPLWDNKDWPKVIQIWKDMKTQGLVWNNMEKFRQNIESAYQNYALEYERKGNWRAAAEVLLQCTENVELALECTKRLDKLGRKHNLF